MGRTVRCVLDSLVNTSWATPTQKFTREIKCSTQGEDDDGLPGGTKTRESGGTRELLETVQLLVKNQDSSLKVFAKMAKGSRKRKRGEDDDESEEEEDVESQPKLIHFKEVRDDAHSVIAWKLRASIRPFNGPDLKTYWENMSKKATPVIEDIQIAHLTKAPINPTAIRKIHDRGAETTGKQWMSTNYSVEDKGGRIRATNDRTAGAFVLDYEDPRGPWEAVDSIFNYTMALRMVRPEDWTGILLLRTLHECRMFNHPRFSAKVQRELIMTMFDQVGG